MSMNRRQFVGSTLAGTVGLLSASRPASAKSLPDAETNARLAAEFMRGLIAEAE